MPGQVAEPVKVERLARLQASLAEQARAFNADMVGSVMPILLDRPGRYPGQIVGRSPYLQPVHLAAPSDAGIGDVIPVRIDAAHPHSLAGTAEPAAGLAQEVAA
jgi:tRNA-2-methylthio-N6-dimethylallyladenosine synthase